MFLTISIIEPITAQEEETTNAEIVVNINQENIPPIQKNWTAIKFNVADFFGIPWEAIKDDPWFGNPILQRFVWPILFGIPDIKRYLGYTSISFDVECPTGWSGKVIPATIERTTSTFRHTITLYLQVTDLASEYNPTIKIKCTRWDVLGDEYGITYVTLPVKAAALSFAFINALEPTKRAAPRSIVYFPIQITNKGEYRGNYEFRIEAEKGILGLVSQQSLLLEPGETKTVELGVMTPEAFYDFGTPRNIKIIVSPLGSPLNKFETNVIVITEGFYVSPLISIVLVSIIILILIIYFLFFILREKWEQGQFGKPEKPWKIPEEKAYLRDLKQDDKQAYEQERRMMKDEYNSAMLWYRHYRDMMRRKEDRPILKTKPKKKTLTPAEKLKEEQKIQQENPKKSLLSFLKKPFEKTPQQTVKPDVPNVDNSKEDALAKIKKEQEKQLRKLK
jgi:hypothetical protein